jgi:hypothetical protein
MPYYTKNGSLIGPGTLSNRSGVHDLDFSRLIGISSLMTLPASSITDPINNASLSYYTDNSLPGLAYSASSSRIIGSSGTFVERAWSYAVYNSRTFSPVCAFCNVRGTSWPYSGTSWESQWWLQNASDADTLVIQLNNTVTLSSISYGTPYEIYSPNSGFFSAYVVTSVSATAITGYTAIGSGAMPSGTTTLSTISAANITGNIFIFKRPSTSGWSRLEEIRLNCV